MGEISQKKTVFFFGSSPKRNIWVKDDLYHEIVFHEVEDKVEGALVFPEMANYDQPRGGDK